MAKTNIKVRLKRALKVSGQELQIAKDGWLTNGHFAIHRGLLISQGMELGAVEDDRVFLAGLGIAVAPPDRCPDLSKVTPKKNLTKVEVTRISHSTEGGMECSIVSGENFSSFVQTAYLELLGNDIYGTVLEGEDAMSALVGAGESFVVMPTRPPENAGEHFRISEHIREYHEKEKR